jgi:hypothetical protein
LSLAKGTTILKYYNRIEMMTDYSQFEAIFEEDEEEELELVLFLVETSNNTKLNRSSVFHRQRWESEYLVNLAIQEVYWINE